MHAPDVCQLEMQKCVHMDFAGFFALFYLFDPIFTLWPNYQPMAIKTQPFVRKSGTKGCGRHWS